MATTRKNTTPDADEHTLVRLADASHYDQWCAGGYVFDRGGEPIGIPHPDAERIVADAAGSLTTEAGA